ncbi:MAG: gamma-glutamyl-gamma-aminobutyrate hydrolase family protein [Treponema sp.]|nr:MAG: gamma-glutamyl-gamma-aminobutyrate hydrolase family protein [Treponema sp.]
MILLLDNYDSFTYNVYQSLAKLTEEEIKVVRSKEITLQDAIKMNPAKLIVSPGPGRPEDAGISVEAIKYFAGKIPVLGICLGHQAIGYAFGAKIVNAKFIKHGIAEEINLDGKGMFRLMGKRETFTRYHSLVIDESTLPADFEISARADDGDIMGIRHKTMPIEGVQFHPESIASPNKGIFHSIFKLPRRAFPGKAGSFFIN